MNDVTCPTCGASVSWTEQYPHRPFCSERCRMIDLGEWASENYRLPTEDGGLHETEENSTMHH